MSRRKKTKKVDSVIVARVTEAVSTATGGLCPICSGTGEVNKDSMEKLLARLEGDLLMRGVKLQRAATILRSERLFTPTGEAAPLTIPTEAGTDD